MKYNGIKTSDKVLDAFARRTRQADSRNGEGMGDGASIKAETRPYQLDETRRRVEKKNLRWRCDHC